MKDLCFFFLSPIFDNFVLLCKVFVCLEVNAAGLFGNGRLFLFF